MQRRFGMARQTFVVRATEDGKLDVIQTSDSVSECRTIPCVYLTGSSRQAARVGRYLAAADISVQMARSVEEAAILLNALDSRVLIADCSFPGGTWKDTLDLVIGSAPRVELVVTAPLTHADLWQTALPAGAFEVVLTPMVGEEVCCVVRAADRYARRLVSSLGR